MLDQIFGKKVKEGREGGREERKQVQSKLSEAHTFFALSRILSLSKTYTLRHELFKKKKGVQTSWHRKREVCLPSAGAMG